MPPVAPSTVRGFDRLRGIASVSATLPFTGERFTPEVGGAIWYEHWHRYCAVRTLAAGKRVLDAACGEGYGSALLADVASKVTGIDIDPEAIRHAVSRYGDKSNLRFVRSSCAALPLADASIDVVISFETIEHVAHQEAMLAEFRRVLVPEGILVVSSPNKLVYSGEAGCVNEYHVKELTREELAAILAAAFPRQAWYGQRMLAHSLLWAENALELRSADLLALTREGVRSLELPAPATYFVVICGGSEATLPALPQLSIFDDGAQSLYRDYERALLAEKHAHFDLADARKIAEERLQEGIVAVNALASSREREEILRGRMASLESALLEAQRDQARAADTAARLADTEARLRFRESWQGWWRWPLSRLRRFVSRLRAPEAARGQPQ
jgi:2-polyprenyl-3-methyl-5-hydroxy-6-metoxy-1,4-benzoquinol methylase